MTTFEIISIGISILALIISGVVFFDNYILSKRGFNRNFRPYLFAINYGYKDEKNQITTMDTKHMILIVVNAPAFITNQKLSFYIRNDGEDELIEEIEEKNITIYPTDRIQHTIGGEIKITDKEMIEKIKLGELIRKVDLRYTWIDQHDENYFFKSEYKYLPENKYWQPISDSAN